MIFFYYGGSASATGATVLEVLNNAISASLTEVVVMGRLAGGAIYIKSSLDDVTNYFT